jgi:hypothetical protein
MEEQNKNNRQKKVYICKKVKFANEKEAELGLQKIMENSDRDKVPIRAYLCNCGSWHLTSKVDKFPNPNNVRATDIVWKTTQKNPSNVNAKEPSHKITLYPKPQPMVELEKKVESLELDIVGLNAIIDHLKSKSGKTESHAHSLESRVYDLTEQLESQRNLNNKLRGDIKDLTNQLNTIKSNGNGNGSGLDKTQGD